MNIAFSDEFNPSEYYDREVDEKYAARHRVFRYLCREWKKSGDSAWYYDALKLLWSQPVAVRPFDEVWKDGTVII